MISVAESFSSPIICSRVDSFSNGRKVRSGSWAAMWGANGLADIEPDFAAVDIEGGHNFDVSGPIRGDLLVHQPDRGAIDGGASIKIDTLDERTGTVAHSNDGDTNLSHGKKEILPAAVRVGQDAMW